MRPEITAFRELESLVRSLGDQLAGYRRRALTAESQCRTLEAELATVREKNASAVRELAEARKAREAVAVDLPPTPEHVLKENAELRELLDKARERTKVVVERVRFLRQQMMVEK